VAEVLNTPLPMTENYTWDELLVWHAQAVRIAKAKAKAGI
jgi:hypothetical protein